jgi:catechol 2,3-dioxygenase-like lactoylglutathione lyase family enzyme
MHRARAFYEQILGLPVTEHNDFARVLDANGTMLRITAVAEACRAGYTVLGWRVADIAAVVRGLAARGVDFLRYDGRNGSGRRWCLDRSWRRQGRLVRRP